MRVKICGITNYQDAMDAIKSGADALGFVFYEKSPRYITPHAAYEIIKELPPFIEKVALFVNEDAKSINEMMHTSKATLAQLHFEVSQEIVDDLKYPHIRVIRAKSSSDILRHSSEYRLIDAYCESYGGSGKRINIEWFKDIDCSKIILAGGLTPQNIKELSKYGFYGVDVSSGVEESYGVKDAKKVKEFIDNATS